MRGQDKVCVCVGSGQVGKGPRSQQGGGFQEQGRGVWIRQKPGGQDKVVLGEGSPASAYPPRPPGCSYPKGTSASVLDRSQWPLWDPAPGCPVEVGPVTTPFHRGESEAQSVGSLTTGHTGGSVHQAVGLPLLSRAAVVSGQPGGPSMLSHHLSLHQQPLPPRPPCATFELLSPRAWVRTGKEVYTAANLRGCGG